MSNTVLFPFELPLILDGATGTQLQKRGMPAGACPEIWVLENAEALADIQSAYVSAGSKAVLAPTFGCNRASLSRYGHEKMTREYCLRLVDISRRAVGELALIGGDMSPCGLMMEPLGEHSFDDIAEIFREQAKALDEAAVDFFMVETQISAQEAKAAVTGIKSVSDRPIFVSFATGVSGLSFWGERLADIAVSIASMGVAAFGVNCCGDLGLMEKILGEIKAAVNIPLMAKPNAGMPREAGGCLIYDMTPEELAARVPGLMGAGARILGGCCGTDETHIAAIAASLRNIHTR